MTRLDSETLSSADLPDDFPQPVPRSRRRRARGPRFLRRLGRKLARVFRLRTILVTLVALLLVGGVGALVLTTDAANRVQSSWLSLSRVLASVNSKPGTEWTLTDFNRLQTGVDELTRSLTTARQQTAFLRPLTKYNGDLAGTLEALDAAQALSLAANDMLAGLQPTLFYLVSGEESGTVVAQLSSGERIVELLGIGRGRFSDAAAHLAEARSELDGLSRAAISPELLLQVQSLDSYHSQLSNLNAMLLQGPDLLTTALGLSGEQSYLIFSQNSDEIRPSGGYVSTFGWMVVRNGRIASYNYSPTTATSPNPPPPEMASQLAVPDWWIRYSQPIYAAWDGSWYADFPATAELARWYYDSGNNPQSPVSGVIAIDLVGFEYILGALGQVVVPGYDEVVTPENFRQVVYDIRASGEGDLPHKQFVAALYRQIFADWQAVARDPQMSSALLGATLRALREKHIMLHFADERLNAAVNLLGWSGAQTPASGHDYLMVVDANLGNKSNRSITRQLTYDVQIQPDGSLASRVTVAYDYPASVAANDPAINPEVHGPLDYNNLLQVFVPQSSVLTSADNLPAEPRVFGPDSYTLFVTRVTIPYDVGERFQFSYTTPPLVESFGPYRRYRLLLQKQPGMLEESVSVQVALPTSVRVVSTSPEAAASFQLDQPIVEFRLELTADTWIELIYRTD